MSHSPSPVHEFHWLHRQRCGHDVVGVVPPPAHHDEPVHLAGDEDEAAWADEAQQGGPHEGVLADQPPAGAHWVYLPTHNLSPLKLHEGVKPAIAAFLTLILSHYSVNYSRKHPENMTDTSGRCNH